MAFKVRERARCAVVLHRRRRHFAGRLPRGRQPGRRAAPAGGVRDRQQWLGHLGAGRRTDRRADLRAEGLGNGVPGVQVDGNDMHRRAQGDAKTRSAWRRAGDGPDACVEAVTYRLSDHTTADDASRYRPAAELEAAWQRETAAAHRAVSSSSGAGGMTRAKPLRAECAAADRCGRARLPGPHRRPAPTPCSTICFCQPAGRTGEQTQTPRAATARRRRSPSRSAHAARGTLVESINLALARALADDPDVVVMGEDVGVNGGVFRATGGPAAALRQAARAGHATGRRPHRRHVGGHGGAGPEGGGRNPVHGFPVPGAGPDRQPHGALRNRTRGRLTCPVVMRMPHGGGIHAPEASFGEPRGAAVRITPACAWCARVTPAAAYGLLLAAIRDPDPVMFLEPTRLYRLAKQDVLDDGKALPLDQAQVLREGDDVTLVSWGAMMHETLRAADQLAQEKISCEVIDLDLASPHRPRHHPGIGGAHRPTGDRARGRAQCGAGRGDRRHRGRASACTTCWRRSSAWPATIP